MDVKPIQSTVLDLWRITYDQQQQTICDVSETQMIQKWLDLFVSFSQKLSHFFEWFLKENREVHDFEKVAVCHQLFFPTAAESLQTPKVPGSEQRQNLIIFQKKL